MKKLIVISLLSIMPLAASSIECSNDITGRLEVQVSPPDYPEVVDLPGDNVGDVGVTNGLRSPPTSQSMYMG